MEHRRFLIVVLFLVEATVLIAREPAAVQAANTGSRLTLSAPVRTGGMPLQEALARRASVREFAKRPLDTRELSQLLWAAQGITHGENRRTAPSAGARYPLELYAATADGFFHYEPRGHVLQRLTEADLRPAISIIAVGQRWIAEAAAVFVFAAVSARTAQRYGEARTARYVHIEIGHAAQNLLLQAVALNLGGAPVGAFDDLQMQKALPVPKDHTIYYLVPVGHLR
ncbi:MAG: SagB/ThcOx family dehydrogenase [Acidobacteriales bacterium]|nr:SagB/ThcOx family dehydrogenase [Terriglobales bacterium]